jgi:broad specificity phosphatase PhoE
VAEIIVVRHGEAEGNAKGIVQGRLPYPLTELGRGQAARVGRFLSRADWSPARIVTSPVARCVETAAIVGAALGLPEAAPDAAFAEIEGGSAEGRPAAEFAQMEGMAAFGGESVEALYVRVARGLDALPPDGGVLIVTHGCVFKAALAHLLGLSGRYWLELRCGTCMRLVRRGAGVHALTHLLHPEEMVVE